MAAIAVNGSHVGTVHAVMLEPLVKRFDPHRFYTLGDQFSNRVVDDRRGDACLHSKTIGEVGGAIEFAAAHMDGAAGCFAKRNDAWIEAMDQRAEGEKIQGAVG